MPQVEVFIASSTDDQTIHKIDTVYPQTTSPVRVTSTLSNTNFCRNSQTAGDYTTRCLLLAFDTGSVLPDNCIINSATLKMQTLGRNNLDSLNIRGEWYNWDGSSASDWAHLVGNNAYDAIITSIATNSYVSVTLNNPTNVSRTGMTKLRFGMSQLTGDAAPTGNNAMNYFLSENNLGHPIPSLVVDYVELETLRPTSVSGLTNLTGAATDIDQDPDDATITDAGLVGTDPSGPTGLTNGPEYVDGPASATAWSGGTGASWGTYANVIDTSETTNSTVTLAATNTDYQNYFSFAAADWTDVPSNATITGVSVTIRLSIGTANRVQTHIALASANGTLVGSEVNTANNTAGSTATQAAITNTEQTISAFGTMPTRADLVTGTFGVRLRQRRSNTSTITIYSIKATVTYSTPGSTVNTQADIVMGDPTGTLATGTDTGEVRVLMRKRGSGSNPTGAIQLRNASGSWTQDITFTETGTTNPTLSSSSWAKFTGKFNQSVITSKTDVIASFIGTGATGGLAEVGPIEWTATVQSGSQNINKTITDNLGITDTMGIVKTMVKSVTDALGILDNTTVARILPKSVNDTVGMTDSANRSLGLGRTVTDSIGITDSSTLTKTIVRSVTDALGVTDSRTVVRTVQRAVTDAIGLLDTANRSVSRTRTVNDTVGLTDTANITLARTRILTDSMSIVDVATPVLTIVITKSITDALGITDNRTLVKTIQRTVTDTLGITDSRTLVKTISRSITDSLGITDNRTVARAISRIVSDTLGMTDSTLKSQAYVKSVTDSLGITDTATKQLLLIITRTITDNIGVTDSRTMIKNVVRNVNDTMGIVDSRTINKAIVRGINDAIGISDTFTKTMTRNRVITDSLGVTDVTIPLKTSFIQRTVNDTLGITDNASSAVFRLIARTVTDNLGIVDNRTRDIHIVRTDVLGMSDAAIKTAQVARTITDELGLIDNQEYIKNIVRTINDVITITDDAGTTLAKFVDVTDQLGLADGVEWRVIGFTVAPFMTAELIAIPNAQAELLGSPQAIGELLGIPSAVGVIEP